MISEYQARMDCNTFLCYIQSQHKNIEAVCYNNDVPKIIIVVKDLHLSGVSGIQLIF